MTWSGYRWAFWIAIAAYLAQAMALLVWLAVTQSAEGPIQPSELVSAARWIPFCAGMAAMFLGGLMLGRFKAFDDALNLALLSTGLFLALDVAVTLALVPQVHTWTWTAYSFLAKILACGSGVWIAGGSDRRR